MHSESKVLHSISLEHKGYLGEILLCTASNISIKILRGFGSNYVPA